MATLTWQSGMPQRALPNFSHVALTSGSGAWGVQKDGLSITGTSCPSTTQCYAVGSTFGGAAFTSGQGSSWSSPTIVPAFTSITAISCPSASVCFVVGQSSPTSMLIDETTNGGSSWVAPLTVSSTTMNGLSSVSCTSTTVCAVGGTMPDSTYLNDGAVAQLTSSGSTLTLATPVKLNWNQAVTGLNCTTTGYCASVDSQSHFWYSTDGGATWGGGTAMPNNFAEISCQSGGGSTTCVAVGGCTPGSSGCSYTSSLGELYWTNNSGTSWTKVTLASTPFVASLTGVACTSTTQCTVIGMQGQQCGSTGCNLNPGYAGSVSLSTGTVSALTLPVDDTEVPSAPPSSLACQSPTSCVIGGPFGIESDSGGNAFYPVAMEVPGILSLSCGTASDCMGVTTDGSLIATNDGGGHWLNMLDPVNTGCSASQPICWTAQSVTCSGPAYCLLQMGTRQTYSYGQGLFETADLGVTWKSKSGSSSTYGCAPNSTTCVGVYPIGGSAWWNAAVSTGYGGSWTSITPSSPPSGSATAIGCGSTSMCLAVGSGGGAELLTSSSGSWTASTVSTGTTANLNGVSCPSATWCMVVGDGGTVLTASVSGTSATFSSLTGHPNIPTASLGLVACDTASSCSIFTNAAGAQTTDGGSTFSTIGALPEPNSTIRTASCGGVGACFAAGMITGPANNPDQESVVLATNGITAQTFLPGTSPLVAADSYGGTDGSRPCFQCALRAAGLSAQGFNGDPVNTADGDYSESVPIVSIPGLGPNLSVTATYDSRLAQAESSSGTTPAPLGWGWSANNSMNLSGTGGYAVTLNEEGGAQIPFSPQPTGLLATGGACTSSGTVQCFGATEGDVTAVLQENIGTSNTYEFSRDNGETIYSFNGTGQLTSIANANGIAVEFAYGVTTGTNCSTTGTTCETEREYNTTTSTWGRELDIVSTTSTGLISKVVDPAGRTWSFAYDAYGNLTGITDPRSQLESFGYDTGSVNPTMVHDLTSLTRPNGQSSGPDPGGQLTVSYEESSSASQAPLGYVIAQSDPASTYQSTHSGSPNGIATSFSYSGNSMAETGTTTITTSTGSPASVVSQSEDEYVQGVLVAHIDGINSAHPETTTYLRNSMDLPVAATDGIGHTTSYAYDGNGNLTSSTDASGNTWNYTYNQFNEMLTSIPPSGSASVETIKTYDSNGNIMTSAIHPSSGTDQTTTYNYVGSPAGLPSSVTDPRGYSTAFTYDTYGDVATSTDPQGDESTYAYTSIGQLFCSTSPKATHAGVSCPSSPATRVANTSSVTFDTSNTLVATSTDPNAHTTTFTYDPNGNRTVSQDPRTYSTVTTFDADDRPVAINAASGTAVQTVTTTAYDVVPSSTNAYCSNAVVGATACVDVIQAQGTGSGTLNSETAHYFDAFGNEIQTTDPGGKVTSNSYDAANNLQSTTTGAGTTTYGYQPNNWLSTETFSGATAGFSAPSTSTSYTYFPDGTRHTMVDSTGTTTYTYGSYGRLASVVNGNGATVSYGYDNDGNVSCMSYPSSGSATCATASSGTGIIAYGYDTADRMNSLTDWNSKTVNFGYDLDSNVNSTTYPTTASTSVALTRGNFDNLTNLTVTNANLAGGSQSTTWTANPDELLATLKVNSGTANAYSYNALDQVTGLAGSDSYAYDQLGRVTSDTPNGSSAIKYGYSTDSALCWSGTGTGTCASPPSGSTRYGTNAINARCYSTTSTTSGTCTAPPSGTSTQSYGYNQLGELTCLTAPNSSGYTCSAPNVSKTTTYAYNGDGLRTSDTPAAGSTQQFTWDPSTSVPELLSDGTNSYLYGPEATPVEQIATSSGTTSYLVSDPTGVRYQFTAAGTVAGSKTYNPYGTCTSCTGFTPFGFEDGYTDTNGLVYLVNRYYDPATEQFISVDPLVSVTGQPFSYANDNPVNGSDPLGLMCFSPACLARDVVVGVAAAAIGLGEAASAAGSGINGACSATWQGFKSFLDPSQDLAPPGGWPKPITFGHGDRHLTDSGLSADSVESAIEHQIRASTNSSASTGGFWGRVVINGHVVEYRAYTLSNGTINVGTYYIVNP